jgi:CubicO group peptidase (beta-lactamase class C family)
MPGERTLPEQPSLRYLKLEAKRRLAAGEFATLHDAQLAIAREHGEPSWARLRHAIEDQQSHALLQVKWVVARFRDADRPGWIPPAAEELRQHFTAEVLTAAPNLVAQLATGAADMRSELVINEMSPLQLRATLNGLVIIASVQDEPPYRLTALAAFPFGRQVKDPRVVTPPPAIAGPAAPAPDGMPGLVDEMFAESGLVALAVAGGDPAAGPPWVVSKGWADLDRMDVLRPGHRFPAPGATMAVTALAALRLVAEERFTLDTPANDLLRAVRLADDTVTVRELLSHTGGVDSPAEVYADAVPRTMPPVIGCGGERGVFHPSNGGCAALGGLIADVTGLGYVNAVTELVLSPLGLDSATFPVRAQELGPGEVTQYDLGPDGRFTPSALPICVIPAAGGLWATPADLVKLGTGWASLLPGWLARQAVTPVVPHAGLGWVLDPDTGTAFHGGAGPAAVASLMIRVRDNRTLVVVTSRLIPLDPIAIRRRWLGA